MGPKTNNLSSTLFNNQQLRQPNVTPKRIHLVFSSQFPNYAESPLPINQLPESNCPPQSPKSFDAQQTPFQRKATQHCLPRDKTEPKPSCLVPAPITSGKLSTTSMPAMTNENGNTWRCWRSVKTPAGRWNTLVQFSVIPKGTSPAACKKSNVNCRHAFACLPACSKSTTTMTRSMIFHNGRLPIRIEI